MKNNQDVTHENDYCPIWFTPTDSGYSSPDDRGMVVNSPRAAGLYFIDELAKNMMIEFIDREKARLTTWLIEQRKLGIEIPELRWTSDGGDDVESLTKRPNLSVHDRADELLKYIQKKTSFIGEEYGFTASNPPPEMFAYTESVEADELQYLLSYLFSQEWLKLTAHETHTQNMNVIITVNGYGRLAELENVIVTSSKAFVAMWFDDSLKPTYDKAIEPAIKDAGYDAVIINREHFLDKIDDQIIAEINRSRFVVADFTHGEDGARGSVYYEAGFAQGQGKDVIFTCRKDMIDKNEIHFDIRQYPYVVWEKNDIEGFKKSLTSRIARVIGDGPLKNKSNSH